VIAVSRGVVADGAPPMSGQVAGVVAGGCAARPGGRSPSARREVDGRNPRARRETGGAGIKEPRTANHTFCPIY
jgi:hypothetical protein